MIKGKCIFLLLGCEKNDWMGLLVQYLGCEKNDWMGLLVQYNLTIDKTFILMEHLSCLMQKRISSCLLQTQYYIFAWPFKPFNIWYAINISFVRYTIWKLHEGLQLFSLFCPHTLLFLCWYYRNCLALVVNYRSH